MLIPVAGTGIEPCPSMTDTGDTVTGHTMITMTALVPTNPTNGGIDTVCENIYNETVVETKVFWRIKKIVVRF